MRDSTRLSIEKTRDSVVVAVHDTVTETKTITYVINQNKNQNEKWDTVFCSVVTEREIVRDRSQLRVESLELRDSMRLKAECFRDSVKMDSVSVEDKKIGLSASAGMESSGKSKKSVFLTTLKWIFAILCALVVLIITLKVCLRRLF